MAEMHSQARASILHGRVCAMQLRGKRATAAFAT